MSSRSRRVLALSLAGIFLLSTIAATVAVLVIMYTDNQPVDQDAAFDDSISDLEDMSIGEPLPDYEPMDEVNELQIIDQQEGDGNEATADSVVVVHYTGALANTGEIFESSKDFGEPVEFPLEDVIEGWTEGIPGMREGGERRLIIPADMAYGERSPSQNIPANSPLVFDIELIEVK